MTGARRAPVTVLDEPAELTALLSEPALADWNRSASYAARVSSLSANLFSTGRLVADAARDTLAGGAQSDWFLAKTTGSPTDTVSDRNGSETLTAIP